MKAQKTSLSAQNLFDKVVKHLRQQKKVSAGKNGDCLYRGPNGTKCAIGCLIPAREYRKSFEGNTFDCLLTKSGLQFCHSKAKPPVTLQKLVKQGHMQLMRKLQSTHDGYKVSQWEDQFQFIAAEFELQYTKP